MAGIEAAENRKTSVMTPPLPPEAVEAAADAILPQMITRDISDENNLEARRRIAAAALTAACETGYVLVAREVTARS